MKEMMESQQENEKEEREKDGDFFSQISRDNEMKRPL